MMRHKLEGMTRTRHADGSVTHISPLVAKYMHVRPYTPEAGRKVLHGNDKRIKNAQAETTLALMAELGRA